MNDDKFVDRFIRRNRAALNEVLKEARASIKRGEGVEVKSYKDFVGTIAKHRRRRPKREKPTP